MFNLLRKHTIADFLRGPQDPLLDPRQNDVTATDIFKVLAAGAESYSAEFHTNLGLLAATIIDLPSCTGRQRYEIAATFMRIVSCAGMHDQDIHRLRELWPSALRELTHEAGLESVDTLLYLSVSNGRVTYREEQLLQAIKRIVETNQCRDGIRHGT